MHFIIRFVAQYFILIPLIVVIIVLVQLKGKKTKLAFIIKLIAAGIVAIILARIASMIWYDPRPFVAGNFVPLFAHASDNGFPSDHTLFASMIGWVVLLYSRKYGIITLFFAFLIGGARILAGVHHPIDILGSFIISLIAVVLIVLVKNIFITKKQPHEIPEQTDGLN